MNRYVVLDLETTGHSPKRGDEIIEVGLVVIDNDQIVDEYSTKVRPTHSIPPFISRLTGLTNEDVKNAPTIQEVLADIMPFFEDRYFIAHNAKFDYDFLNDALLRNGYSGLECPTIDTVELSRIFLPFADGYKLSELTSYLHIEHFSPHRALSDAYVTGLLFLEIMNRLDKLPLETLQQLLSFSQQYDSDFEWVLDDMIEEKRYKYESDHNLILQNGFAVKRIDQPTQPDVDIQLSFDEFVGQFFNQEPNEARTGQIQMANEIYHSFQNNQNAAIEAEAGMGKTIGYLLPATYFSLRNKEQVVISTQTIQLQNQIIVKDWMKIAESTELPIQVSLLKSSSHYINLERLRLFLETYPIHSNYDIILSLSIILVWLTETKTGDREELQLPTKGEHIWPFISGDDAGNKEEERSSYYHLAEQEAKQANVVVVNHAFLLNPDRKDSVDMLDYPYMIIDEAHHFENVARNQLAKKIDYVGLVDLLGSISRFQDFIEVEQAKAQADEFFRNVYEAVDFLHESDNELSDTGKFQLFLDEEHLSLFQQGPIKQSFSEFVAACQKLIRTMAGQIKSRERTKIFHIQLMERLKKMLNVLELFFQEDHMAIRWIEIDQDGAKNAVQINLQPMVLKPYMQGLFENKNRKSTIFTSATLKTNQSYSTFLEPLGLEEDIKKVTIPADYKLQEQTRIYVPNDFPNVIHSNPKKYASEIARFTKKILDEVNDKAIVLFTSYEMLNDVHYELKSMLSVNSFDVLSQGISTGSKDKLKKMFERSEHAVLLGTNSFWEGVDISGESLKVIILVRLPFDPPNHPVLRAKANWYHDQDKNPFYHLALPQAILRFRQAYGRLIRNNEDRGILFVLDQRMMKKSYGKHFVKSLPDLPITHENTDHIIQDAKNWVTYNN
ncbi:ATP-dependent DNA helicase DinG [Halalkalibacillus sediminis]|uniref:ATP-dependent DNA helicase DinG n=1 Tax=Halalkalibacillus sediminis TaxID=2018042 RepID=UPI0013904889|nr:ATP-dependent DNA helicase DinG [Halalkalibacillus sediminis]